MSTEISHLMVIPDGDRTFAIRTQSSLEDAYRVAANRLLDVIHWVHGDFRIPQLSLFALAEYNLRRPKHELAPILAAGRHFLEKYLASGVRDHVALHVNGELDALFLVDPEFRPLVTRVRETEGTQRFRTNVLIAYSGEKALERAVAQCAKNSGPLNFNRLVAAHALSAPVDVVVRTAGHRGFRFSGLFLGASQARCFSIPPLFPELCRTDLEDVFVHYRAEAH